MVRSVLLDVLGALSILSLYQWKDLSMFLKYYLAKMDLVLILSKFSGQIGPRPNVLCSIKQFDRSDRVNGKRPYTRSYYRKENAADMYMQDVLQPRSVFFNSLSVSTSITSYNCISHLIL